MAKFGKLPDWVHTEPKLEADDDFYLEWYEELSSERPVLMQGYASIPVTKIIEIINELGYPHREYFIGVMRGIEDAQLSDQNEKDKKKRKEKDRETAQKTRQRLGNKRKRVKR